MPQPDVGEHCARMARSCHPSALKSPTTKRSASQSREALRSELKDASPLPKRMEMSCEFLTPIARSGFPSRLKSPTASSNDEVPPGMGPLSANPP